MKINIFTAIASLSRLLLLLALLDSLVYSDQICYNNGTLKVEGKRRTCACQHPFAGQFCEDYACVNGLSTGLQYDPKNLFFNKRCLCDPGWTGVLCSSSLINRCGEHGSDIDGNCKCKKNFVGDRCQYVTRCVNGQLYNGRCACHYGWKGNFCDQIICHQGYADKSNKMCICPSKYRGKFCDFCAEPSSSPPPECAEIARPMIEMNGDNVPIILAVVIAIGLVVLGAILYFLCSAISKMKKAKEQVRQSKADIENGSPNSACENCPLNGSVRTQNISTELTAESGKFYDLPPPSYETLTPLHKEQNELQNAADKTIGEATTVTKDSTNEEEVDSLETVGKKMQLITESIKSADKAEQSESSNVENGIIIDQERSFNKTEQSKRNQSNAEQVENNQMKEEFQANGKLSNKKEN